MRRALIVIVAMAFVISCKDNRVSGNQDFRVKVENAVRRQLDLYPESTLQDLYKSFFQAEFGAEHIVADTTSAGKYLDRELGTPDKSSIRYEPIGADSSFFRVHLNVVQAGLVSRQQLFDAFLQGVHAVSIPEIDTWVGKWADIQSIIDSMGLDFPNYDSDKESISSVLESGSYAMHHSEEFERLYDPHYRIIRKDLFYDQLYPYLSN